MTLIDLYRAMYKARAFELGLAGLWHQGLITGELHLGTGEEAIAAGVTVHMRSGDGIALDHRGTPFLTLLGVDMRLMLKEMLGREDGLCGGRGGHMHLFSLDHLAATSGIVGAAGPLAAGFALAAQRLRPGCVGIAVFGEGAANQGMLMESQNLAAAWSLPLIFICKDNGWAIATRSAAVTGGSLLKRAEAFGLTVQDVDGLDVLAVWSSAGKAFELARRGGGPQFLRLTCSRLDGHFLGDPLLRLTHRPLADGLEALRKTLSAAFSLKGGRLRDRAAGLGAMMRILGEARKDLYEGENDPLARARRALNGQADEVCRIHEEIDRATSEAVDKVLRKENEWPA
jgi:TPP-dependent pyruvate/acetoin dehydrogenase alpha subunit